MQEHRGYEKNLLKYFHSHWNTCMFVVFIYISNLFWYQNIGILGLEICIVSFWKMYYQLRTWITSLWNLYIHIPRLRYHDELGKSCGVSIKARYAGPGNMYYDLQECNSCSLHQSKTHFAWKHVHLPAAREDMFLFYSKIYFAWEQTCVILHSKSNYIVPGNMYYMYYYMQKRSVLWWVVNTCTYVEIKDLRCLGTWNIRNPNM